MIKLQNNIPPDIYVMADSLMMWSIIQNLVTNEIKYTKQGGFVFINAKTEQKMASIFVEDSGVGMTSEMKERLFMNRNYESLSGTNNEQGSGLGLLLVNDFVAQHGGKIDVQSMVGAGTTVSFTIPVIGVDT